MISTCNFSSIAARAPKLSFLSDPSMDAHVQDVLDIMSHLQYSCGDQDLTNLIFFMHRRAFRKLGLWVKAFVEHWGRSPFRIVEDCIESILKLPGYELAHSFRIRLDDPQYKLVRTFIEDEVVTSGEYLYSYTVNESNIQQWVALFNHLWDLLGGELLETVSSYLDFESAPTIRKVKSKPPTKASTERITLAISCLHSLRHISEHIVHLRGTELHRAFVIAGTPISVFLNSMAHVGFRSS